MHLQWWGPSTQRAWILAGQLQHKDYLSWGILYTEQSLHFRTLLTWFSNTWYRLHPSKGWLIQPYCRVLSVYSIPNAQKLEQQVYAVRVLTRCAIKLCHLRTPTLCFRNLNYAPSFFFKMDKIPYNIIQGLNCSFSCQATAYMLPRDQIHDPMTPQKRGGLSHGWYACDQVRHFLANKGQVYTWALRQSRTHYLLACIIPKRIINDGFCMQHQMREPRLSPGLTSCPSSCLLT